MNILICEICNTPIAKFEKITYPMRPEQFTSYDSVHNPDNPFPKGTDWDFMKCPECRNRPFLLRTRVKTDKGFYIVKMSGGADIEDDLGLWGRMETELSETVHRIETDKMTPAELRQAKIKKEFTEDITFDIQPTIETNPLTCQVCGKVCKSPLGLHSHMRSHSKNG